LIFGITRFCIGVVLVSEICLLALHMCVLVEGKNTSKKSRTDIVFFVGGRDECIEQITNRSFILFLLVEGKNTSNKSRRDIVFVCGWKERLHRTNHEQIFYLFVGGRGGHIKW